MNVELRDGFLHAVVSTSGGCLLRLDLVEDSIPLLRPFDGGATNLHPTQTAAFPLIPFANRVRGGEFTQDGRRIGFQPNTPGGAPYLHGDAWLGEWQVEESTSRSARLSFSRSADEVSAYTYAAEQTLTLDNGTLHVDFSVSNRGPFALPFGIGHHPYFPWRPGTAVRIGRMEGFWSEGFDYLPDRPMRTPVDLRFNDFAPLPHRRINNVYDGWDGRAWIQWPLNRVALSIRATPEFRWLMLFINTPERDPDYRFDSFCLEPMTHIPGGHDGPGDTGFVQLPPGETLRAGIAYEVSFPS